MKKSRAVVASVMLLVSLFAVTAGAIDINGGQSWGGWDRRGNSLDVGLWGAGSVTRSYDLYTAVFASDGKMTSSGGTQIGGGGLTAGVFSPGAFADGHTILAIGLDMNAPARAVGTSFITFGLGDSSFRAASALGAEDGRVEGSKWANAGDFSIWMDGVNANGPSNLGAYMNNGTEKGGSGNVSNLPGGYGSGVSYDFAFRLFREGTEGGALQYFFDLTAMQALYGASQPHNIASHWNPAGGQIGEIGDSITISLYNSDPNYANANRVVFDVGTSVPDGGATLVLLGGALTGLAAVLRRKRA